MFLFSIPRDEKLYTWYSRSKCISRKYKMYFPLLALNSILSPPSVPSVVAQMVKNLPAMQETWARSLGWEDPLEEGMATHSSILAWRIPWTKELVGYIPWGRKESDMTEQLTLSLPLCSQMDTLHFRNHCIFYLLLKNGIHFLVKSPPANQTIDSGKTGILLSLKIRPHSFREESSLYTNVKWVLVGMWVFPTAGTSSRSCPLQSRGS